MSNHPFHIVFTDLDGTLLDHHDYSHEHSMPGIALLCKSRIPLVLVSSKTAAEMEVLRRELDLSGPFVCENGAGIVYTAGPGKDSRLEATGMSAVEIASRAPLLEQVIGTKVLLLIDMAPDEIAARTGLDRTAAALAGERSFTVPFLTADGSPVDLGRVNRMLTPHGLAVTRGGRFYHLGTAGVDKGRGVERVREHYRAAAGGSKIITTGIGDSENDLAMLKAVDRPVLVRKPDGSVIETDMDVMVTERSGPDGFTEAIFRLFPGSS